jgi:hypothetical protein
MAISSSCRYWPVFQRHLLPPSSGSASKLLWNISRYKTTQCNIPEDNHLSTHCSEILKSHIVRQLIPFCNYCASKMEPTFIFDLLVAGLWLALRLDWICQLTIVCSFLLHSSNPFCQFCHSCRFSIQRYLAHYLKERVCLLILYNEYKWSKKIWVCNFSLHVLKYECSVY